MNDKPCDQLEPDLKRKLGLLTDVPGRDPQASAQGRARYLVLSRKLAQKDAALGAVSTAPVWRLNGWMRTIFNRPPGKESYAMLTTVVSIVMAFALLFGGAGVTAYAAQDSLPSDVLYPLKTMSEDLRLELASSQQAQFELALAYANRRMEEISAMLGAGEPVGEQVGTRLQEHLDLALRLAARMSDQDMEQALLRTRQQIRDQLRTMEMLQSSAPEQAKGALERIQAMLQAQNRMAELGLEDPLTFRLQFQQGAGQGPQPEPAGNGPGPQQEPSGNGQGNGPGPQQEPSGNGQGNGPDPQQEPSDNGQGNGPGPQQEPSDNGQGNGPGPQQEPSGNGQGNGPGPQQEPSDNGQGNGPGPQQEPPVTDHGNSPGPQQEPPISSPAPQPEPSGGGQGGSGSGGGGH